MTFDLTTIISSHGIRLPSTDALLRQLQKTTLDIVVENVLDPTQHSLPDSTARVVKVNGLTFAILGVTVPLPLDQLLYGPTPDLFWPTAERDLQHRTGHLRVLMIDDAGRPVLEQARTQVLLTAALCCQMNALGVLWCASDHAMSADRFVQIATTPVSKSEGYMYAPIWVRLLAAQTEQGLIVATRGVTNLGGGPELEFGPTKALDLATLAKRAMLTAHIVLTGQITLTPGETIAPEDFLVTKSMSSFENAPVLRLIPTKLG